MLLLMEIMPHNPSGFVGYNLCNPASVLVTSGRFLRYLVKLQDTISTVHGC